MIDSLIKYCKNCNTEVTLNYCPNCGEPVKVKRIDAHYIVHEIEHVLHFEKGILYTVRELLIRPGESVRYFIKENRNRLVKPIIFIIVTSLIYTLINHFFDVKEGYVQYQEVQNSTTGMIFKWVQAHYGYSNILMGLCIAFWTKLIFKKYGYNFYEILILLCFVMGIGMLLLAVFTIFHALTHFDIMQIAGFISIVYCIWGIAQFFDKKKPSSYFKAFASYMLGLLTFTLAAMLVGTVIDAFSK